MPKTPIERKLGYLRGLASDRGVEQATLTWEARLSEIQFRVALNVLYRFTLDLYLNLNLHLDTSEFDWYPFCLLYTSPSPRDRQKSRMPSSA